MSRLLLVLVCSLAVSPAALSQIETPATNPAAASATPAASPVAGAIPDLSGVTPLPLEGQRRADFAAFMAQTMTECTVPGASVAVVQNGAVVYLQGFGVREHGRPDPVTPDTLMRIGSVTKSVTTTMAGTLVDDGLVDWTTPVVTLLPGLALPDSALTARLTLDDLFSAASGLPRRDLEFIFEADAYSPEGLIAAVRDMPLTAPVGARYQYSNQAFALGGYAAAAADGASPNDLLAGYLVAVQHRVLNPIGMPRSTFALADAVASGDYAVPHAPDLTGTPQAISLLIEDRFTNAVAPAGALWSSAREMARYLQTQLGAGIAPDGTRVISRENLQHTWQPGVAVPADPWLPPVVAEGIARYGRGWFVGDYGGLELISHSGGTYGFSAELAFLPEVGLGIVVLTNDSICGAVLAFAAQYRLFEIVFEQPPVTEAAFSEFAALLAGQRGAAAILLGPVDPDAVMELLGRFEHPDLGEITLTFENGDFVLDAGEISSRLVPLRSLPGQPVQYVAIDPPLGGTPAPITFEPDAGGRPRPVLTFPVDPGDPPLVYTFTPIAADAEAQRATPMP